MVTGRNTVEKEAEEGKNFGTFVQDMGGINSFKMKKIRTSFYRNSSSTNDIRKNYKIKPDIETTFGIESLYQLVLV